MANDKCNHCNENITQVKRPGVKCVKCNKWMHRSCAKMLPSHQIWTCEDCKRKQPQAQNQRRSLLPTPSSRYSNSNSSLRRSTGPQLSVASEIAEIKETNSKILKMLSTFEEKFQLLSEYRDENARLNAANRRLAVELAQVNREICKNNLQISSADSVNKKICTEPLVASNETFEGFPNGINARLEPRHNIMQTNVASTSNEPSPNNLCAIKPMKWLYLSNLRPETTCEDIKAHIVSRSKNRIHRGLIQCSNLTPKSILNPFFMSFKIGVPEECFKDVSALEAWPYNADVREFANTRPSNFRLDSAASNRK